MRKPVILPDLGASSPILSLWFADPGDSVYAGDRLAEILAGGATFDVLSPATGILAEKCAYPDDPLFPGQVLGMVEEEEENGNDHPPSPENERTQPES